MHSPAPLQLYRLGQGWVGSSPVGRLWVSWWATSWAKDNSGLWKHRRPTTFWAGWARAQKREVIIPFYSAPNLSPPRVPPTQDRYQKASQWRAAKMAESWSTMRSWGTSACSARRQDSFRAPTAGPVPTRWLEVKLFTAAFKNFTCSKSAQDKTNSDIKQSNSRESSPPGNLNIIRSHEKKNLLENKYMDEQPLVDFASPTDNSSYRPNKPSFFLFLTSFSKCMLLYTQISIQIKIYLNTIVFSLIFQWKQNLKLTLFRLCFKKLRNSDGTLNPRIIQLMTLRVVLDL